ncbi:MAG: hypothetical protein EA384_04420 [Spirochaetaceae bacterium]|nr:MAG: hypothetical protein EA384_04420 [Spirochaetaceae bacterium]
MRRLPLRGMLLTGMLIVLLISCGLDVIVFLEGPRTDRIDDQGPALPIVAFRHNAQSNNVPEFRGYEVYYKFYDDDGGAGQNTFEADRNAVLASPISTGPSRLENRGYRRLRGRLPADPEGTERPRPLIGIAPADKDDSSIVVTLTFQADPDRQPPDQAIVYWPYESDERLRVLERNTGSATGKNFLPVASDRYSTADDDDLPAGLNVGVVLDRDDLAIGLFVLAYGIDSQTIREIYSEPVKLSYARLQKD